MLLLCSNRCRIANNFHILSWIYTHIIVCANLVGGLFSQLMVMSKFDDPSGIWPQTFGTFRGRARQFHFLTINT
jgi:hypothetical protein